MKRADIDPLEFLIKTAEDYLQEIPKAQAAIDGATNEDELTLAAVIANTQQLQRMACENAVGMAGMMRLMMEVLKERKKNE